jgi:IS1 family transposase
MEIRKKGESHRFGMPPTFERTNLTSRQISGRLVRKTLSHSKELAMLKASCAWED